MRKFSGIHALLLAAVLPISLAGAQDITISDANVNFSVEFNATPQVYTATADFFQADPGGDPAGVLFKTAWAYRIDNDTQEFIFNDGGGQAIFSSAGNTGTATWADVDARGLISATATYQAISTSGTTGVVVGSMSITNLSAAAINLNVYHLADLDVGGALFSSNVTSTGSNGHQVVSVSGSSERADHAAFGADHWEVGGYTNTTNPMGGACTYASLTDLYTRLENTTVDDLRDDQCPWGPIDIRGAYQWANRTLQPNQTETFMIAFGHNVRACPAAEVSYGAGIGGANGVPTIGSVSGAVLGGSLVPTLGNCPAGTQAALNVGLVATNIPLFDIPILTDQNLLTYNLTVDGSGNAIAPVGIPIPNDGALCGLHVYGQGIVIDFTTTSTSPFPVTATAGIDWTVGSY